MMTPTSRGPPHDRDNGDHPPVVTTARILIVPYPDATITPVDPMCANALTGNIVGGMIRVVHGPEAG
jgi:hypothetical protein